MTIKVKPLVWREKSAFHHYTDPEPGSPPGTPMCYVIKRYPGDRGLWDLYGPGHWGPGNKFKTLEAAKAAAQAHHEARILSAIEEVSPATIRAEAPRKLAEVIALQMEIMQSLGQSWPVTTAEKIAAILALIDKDQDHG